MGIGGTEQVIFQLVNHADETLFENSIVCLEGEIGPIGQQLQESGTHFHILNRNPGFDLNLHLKLFSPSMVAFTRTDTAGKDG